MNRHIANIYYDTTMLDGYSWAEQQANSVHGTLFADPNIGEWPYNIVVRGARDDCFIIKQFVEGDVTTWVYTQRSEYTKALKEMRKATV